MPCSHVTFLWHLPYPHQSSLGSFIPLDEPGMVVGMRVGLACIWHSMEISLVVWEYRRPFLALRVGCDPWLKSQAGEGWLDVGSSDTWFGEAVSAIKTVVNFACRITLRDSEGGGIISCSPLSLQSYLQILVKGPCNFQMCFVWVHIVLNLNVLSQAMPSLDCHTS